MFFKKVLILTLSLFSTLLLKGSVELKRPVSYYKTELVSEGRTAYFLMFESDRQEEYIFIRIYPEKNILTKYTYNIKGIYLVCEKDILYLEDIAALK